MRERFWIFIPVGRCPKLSPTAIFSGVSEFGLEGTKPPWAGIPILLLTSWETLGYSLNSSEPVTSSVYESNMGVYLTEMSG